MFDKLNIYDNLLIIMGDSLYINYPFSLLLDNNMNETERKELDAKLSGNFKSGDIIADEKWDIIWAFDKVAYHGWSPEIECYGRYIFAEFKQAISRQWRKEYEAFDNGCWDDDVYIDSKRYKLPDYYRFATEAESLLFQTLIAEKKNSKSNEESRPAIPSHWFRWWEDNY